MKTIINVITAFIFVAGSVQAATFDRGSGLIYDDVLDITWLQNANQAVGSRHTTINDGIHAGRMHGDNPFFWADELSFAGYDDWRSVSMDVNNDGIIITCNGSNELACRDNELAYMFYENLGGSFGEDLTGDLGLFKNIKSTYWSSTPFGDSGFESWSFGFDGGHQGGNITANLNFAWAVRPGDVSVEIPEPTTFTLLGLGFLGLLGSARSKRRHCALC
jgi:hypothetical protein